MCHCWAGDLMLVIVSANVCHNLSRTSISISFHPSIQFSTLSNLARKASSFSSKHRFVAATVSNRLSLGYSNQVQPWSCTWSNLLHIILAENGAWLGYDLRPFYSLVEGSRCLTIWCWSDVSSALVRGGLGPARIRLIFRLGPWTCWAETKLMKQGWLWWIAEMKLDEVVLSVEVLTPAIGHLKIPPTKPFTAPQQLD